ncbi:Eukaryotic translation initiation factor 3 subunit C [Vanrija pseudolonga]|uniref:Eukaryotic translation initiation factor 3 subunit C n=1 Tax=Vanrija pseudolonga TaxID=143232 RepID=A0AAF1BIW6_9TREE|nr:Eukaryotic translation initiation factor 3 subunit C [Vanrija pseudolonga]
MSFFAKLGSDSSDNSDSEDESLRSGSEDEKPQRSNFLRGGDDSDDSDDDSSDEEEEMSDDDSDSDVGGGANKFLRGASSDEDSDDEDEKIKVLSAKDKRFAEMDAAITSIQNATKSGGAASDWVAASAELDKLIRFITRHQTSMTASATPPAGHIPPAFLQTITELEKDVNDTIAGEKSATKKMPGAKSKALNSMKQTLKKKAKEFEGVIAQYTADPVAYTAAYDAANVPPKVEKVKVARTPVAGEEGRDDDFTTIGRGGRQLNLTADGVFKTLRDIFEQRGKKNTDRAETIRILSKLLEVSETTYQKIRVLLALIPARLDYSQNLASIPHESWVLCLKEFEQLVTLLLQHQEYVVKDNVEEYDDLVERVPEKAGDRVAVTGNLVSLLENLDNEFTKTLQHTDAHEHGTEYIARLREEAPLYVAITKAQVLFEREKWADQTVRAVMRRLEHVYSKPDSIVDHFEAAVAQSVAGLQSEITPFGVQRDASALIHLLCVYIYHSDAPLLRARAILAHIFNHAIHARYHQARDLLLMSHLQDTIQHADVTTQIMYNRALVQLGLAAFRRGFINECQQLLSEMFQTQRQKELLAQAVQRYNLQLSPEQELIEKRRLLPFHMHLNIELLEAAYLTSCMLVEIPLLASVDTEEQRRRIASKTFKRLLDLADKQAFMGPPENTRDHIIKASKALQAGEWERARDLILSIKIWQLLDDVKDVETMLARRIQEEGLRTYLFTYAPYYASLSLAHLAATFDLPQQTVTSIISRMIYTDELAASLDQIDQVVVFHRVEQTEVQRLAQQLAERAVLMVEQNEKTLDVKLGQAPGNDRTTNRDGQAAGGSGGRQERRGGARGSYRGRGNRGRTGFNSGLGSRRVAA